MATIRYTDIYGGGRGSPNFPIVKMFTESGSYIFPCHGTIFMRAVGAGAGAGAKVGGSGGWGQVVKNVQAGDQVAFAIGAGGIGGYSKSQSGSSGWDFYVATDGGDTIVTLRDEEYLAAGGAGQSDRFVTAGNAPKPSTGPWDFCLPGGVFGSGNVQGVLLNNNRNDSQLDGWGTKITDGNKVFSSVAPAGLFAAGSSAMGSGYNGYAGGLGAGGGTGFLTLNQDGSVYGWLYGGRGGDGLVILYFWPQTNP